MIMEGLHIKKTIDNNEDMSDLGSGDSDSNEELKITFGNNDLIFS